jgi:hypothetical protein
VAAEAEGIEDLDRVRDPLKEEFESRVPLKQGSTAGSNMTLLFLGKSSLNLLFNGNQQPVP